MAEKIIAFYRQRNRAGLQRRLKALQEHVTENFSLEKFKAGYLAGYLKVVSK